MIEDKRKRWGELGELPYAKYPAEKIIADLYVDVPVECGEMRSSIISASDWLGVRLHYNEPPETIAKERPALHLTCHYGIYEKGNPGWHKLILTGYASGKEPATEELLWHKDNLKYRGGLLAKIRNMAKQMAEMQ